MPKWTEYTSKDTLADNDEVMLYDATARANKRGLMSKFWNYVVDKMSTAVISKLETNNKTIIGAINALNSETSGKTFSITLRDNISTNSFARCIVFGRLCLVYMALYPKEAFNDGDVLVDLSVSAKEMTFAAINSGLADSYIQVLENKIYYKGTQNSSRIRGEILFLVS
jgi:hypothetical protein